MNVSSKKDASVRRRQGDSKKRVKGGRREGKVEADLFLDWEPIRASLTGPHLISRGCRDHEHVGAERTEDHP